MIIFKKIRIIVSVSCVVFLIPVALFSQVDKITDIDFVYKKIKTVYAGYKNKVKSNDFEKIIKLTRAASYKDEDTFAALSRITSYFNDHHLSLYEKRFNKNIDTALCSLNYERLYKLIGNRTKKNKYEGYWINELNSIVIYLKKVQKNQLDGFIIETSIPAVPRGYCIIKVKENKMHKGLTDYISIDGEFRVFTKTHFKSDSVLIGNSFSKWHKLNSYKPDFLESQHPIIYKPSVIVIDSNNVLIMMNNFSTKGIAKVYDSLIRENEKSIANCKNLIIDIRNNGGGSIRSFIPLLPFICSKPLLHVGAFVLCSNDLIEDAKESRKVYNERKDTAKVLAYDEFITRMVAHKDDFIYNPPDTFPCVQLPSKIKNVALLINHGCRSAAELMILMLKQINMVKTFGESTAGSVDYLDMITYELPVSKYIFWVGTTQREITKNAPLYDNVGIPPDVEIPENIMDWPGFVKKYYEQIK